MTKLENYDGAVPNTSKVVLPEYARWRKHFLAKLSLVDGKLVYYFLKLPFDEWPRESIPDRVYSNLEDGVYSYRDDNDKTSHDFAIIKHDLEDLIDTDKNGCIAYLENELLFKEFETKSLK